MTEGGRPLLARAPATKKISRVTMVAEARKVVGQLAEGRVASAQYVHDEFSRESVHACLLYVTPDWAGDLVSAGPLALVHA